MFFVLLSGNERVVGIFFVCSDYFSNELKWIVKLALTCWRECVCVCNSMAGCNTHCHCQLIIHTFDIFRIIEKFKKNLKIKLQIHFPIGQGQIIMIYILNWIFFGQCKSNEQHLTDIIKWMNSRFFKFKVKFCFCMEWINRIGCEYWVVEQIYQSWTILNWIYSTLNMGHVIY